jgi:abequosyltransferase
MQREPDLVTLRHGKGISMETNPHLSIVIPTYNRADFLDRCLELAIPLARAHNILIYVSDNTSTDATPEVVGKRIAEYPLIRYGRNEKNLGPDGNFERALKQAQTEYVWLLGDTYRIPDDGVGRLIELISRSNGKYDALVLNFHDRVPGVSGKDYTDQNELLSDLGWHMTCMSSLVYSSRLILGAAFERYRETSFIQTGIVFEYIASTAFAIHWAPTISVHTLSLEGRAKLSCWQHQIFEIWTRRWANFVFSLPPSYDLDVKLSCIKDHAAKTGIFSCKSLLLYRCRNFFNTKIYLQYYRLFPLVSERSRFFLLVIALLPGAIPRTLKLVIKLASGIKRN